MGVFLWARYPCRLKPYTNALQERWDEHQWLRRFVAQTVAQKIAQKIEVKTYHDVGTSPARLEAFSPEPIPLVSHAFVR